MQDKILATYVLMDLLFVVCGGLLLIFALVTKSELTQTPTIQNVATDLLLNECPLTAAIANSVLVFFTFLVSVPAMVAPMTRGWLKFHGYLVVVCAIFTMLIGLTIWFDTLKTRQNLSDIWNAQPSTTQSLLQQRFNCCGYNNATSPPFFVPDSTCPNPLAAAANIGCVTPFVNFANTFLDTIFTGAFGIVGVDVALILTVAMLLKDRKEKERYRHIDEKQGTGSF
ncbi:tetraspanin [Hyaloscypha sp. PMI_1271]|nr:tetraspanin [Hyaloscypha sp. PMI_1271]